MIEADLSTFKIYLRILEILSKYLSKKYTECKDNSTEHYQTIIIQKIVKMLKTLETLTTEVQDETSARCVLRGILDNVAIYCFVYSSEDTDEMMFRHYLYNLDGFQTLKEVVEKCPLEQSSNKTHELDKIDKIIKQIREKLNSHPYVQSQNEKIKKIIETANWKYKSLQNLHPLSFKDIYINIGLSEENAIYCQSFLSQFSHGLCLSNKPYSNDNENVLLESIPLIFIMIKSIAQAFPKENIADVIKKTIDLNNSNFDRTKWFENINAIKKGEIVYI